MINSVPTLVPSGYLFRPIFTALRNACVMLGIGALALVTPTASAGAISTIGHLCTAAVLAQLGSDLVEAKEKLGEVQRANGTGRGEAGALALFELGVLRLSQDKREEGRNLLTEAMAVFDAMTHPSPEHLSETAWMLAMEYTETNEDAKAEPLMRRVITLLESVDRDGWDEFDQLVRGDSLDQRYAGALSTLGQMLLQQERWTEALPILQKSVPVLGKVFGDDHRITILEVISLANVLVQLDQLQAAAEAFDTVLDGPSANDSAVKPSRVRRDAIRNLGSLAADGPPTGDALTSLRQRLSDVEDGPVRFEMTEILERRAARQYADKPSDNAWKVNCDAHADVLLASASRETREMQNQMFSRTCQEKVVRAIKGVSTQAEAP